MAEKINDGGPAFPIPLQPGQGWQEMAPCDGMTMRDYFAAKAMQGMLACEMLRATEQEFAERAYKLADAMLKARGDTK